MRTLNLAFYVVLSAILLVSVGLTLIFAYKAVQFNQLLNPKSAGAHPGIHLMLISQEYDNPYWRFVEQGAKAAAREKGIAIEYLGPIQADFKEHIKIIEMAIASKVDGIITQGLNEDDFTPVINKAIAMGIPVITIDSDSPQSDRIAYIGTDNYAAGYMAGEALIEESGGQAVVGIVTGSFSVSNQIARVQGFMDAITDHPDIQVAAIEESNIDLMQSAAKAHTLINRYPEIDTFYGSSALDGIGIAKMLQDLHIHTDESETKKKRVIAFDDLPETLELIRQDIIDVTIVQQPYTMGYESVYLMLDHLAGKSIAKIYNTDAQAVRKSDLTNFGGGHDE